MEPTFDVTNNIYVRIEKRFACRTLISPEEIGEEIKG